MIGPVRPAIPAFALLLAAQAPPSEAPRPGLEVKIMSFNIRWSGRHDTADAWEYRRPLVCDVILNSAPDAVGLQEVMSSYIPELTECLPRYAVYPGNGRAAAFLYRVDRFRVDDAACEFENRNPEQPAKDWGPGSVRVPNCMRLVEESTGRGFYLYNNPLDHRFQASREWSVRVLARRLRERHHPDPVVLTGDFNAPEHGPTMDFLRGETTLLDDDGRVVSNTHPFVDSFRSAYPDAEIVGTFHGMRGTRTGKKVDHVLVPPGTEVLDAEILYHEVDGLYPSDHFPVTARIRLPSAEP